MNEYQRRLGARLRAIRRQQGMTLHEVEQTSGGRWKAVVVGSYERGDRAVSVSKLAQLGEFYGVPVAELLPEEDGGGTATTGGLGTHKIKLDLRALSRDDLDPALETVSRFAHTIQLQRGDYNGNVLTIRAEDLRALSVFYGTAPDDLVDRLQHQGVLAA